MKSGKKNKIELKSLVEKATQYQAMYGATVDYWLKQLIEEE